MIQRNRRQLPVDSGSHITGAGSRLWTVIVVIHTRFRPLQQ